MTAIARSEFKTHIVLNLIDEVVTGNNIYYLAISRPQPWANDSLPDTPVDAREQVVSFWRDLYAGKKVTGNDLAPVVPRVDWTANGVYNQYESNVNIANNFYIMTTDYNVYKCISNANGAFSTSMPTYTSPDRTNTESDGYIWKYMYTLRTIDRVRFLTQHWMPVRRITINDGTLQWRVQQDAIVGALNQIDVSNVGVHYTDANTIAVTISGDGVAAAGFAQINVSSQTVSNIIMTSVGSGYNFANATLSGGGGSGALLHCVISPTGGHGSDPVFELKATSLMINIRLNADENSKISANNDYRQIGILLNPLVYASSNAFSNTVFSQVTEVFLGTGSGDFILDEYVFQGISLQAATFTARVLDWDSTNNILYLVELNGTPTAASLVGLTSGVGRFITSIGSPDVQPYSGRLLSLENITPIQRALDQTDDLRVVLEF